MLTAKIALILKQLNCFQDMSKQWLYSTHQKWHAVAALGSHQESINNESHAGQVWRWLQRRVGPDMLFRTAVLGLGRAGLYWHCVDFECREPVRYCIPPPPRPRSYGSPPFSRSTREPSRRTGTAARGSPSGCACGSRDSCPHTPWWRQGSQLQHLCVTSLHNPMHPLKLFPVLHRLSRGWDLFGGVHSWEAFISGRLYSGSTSLSLIVVPTPTVLHLAMRT